MQVVEKGILIDMHFAQQVATTLNTNSNIYTTLIFNLQCNIVLSDKLQENVIHSSTVG